MEIEVRPLVPEFVRERDSAERNSAARIPTLRASIPVESASRRPSVDEHHAPTVAHGGSTPPGEKPPRTNIDDGLAGTAPL